MGEVGFFLPRAESLERSRREKSAFGLLEGAAEPLKFGSGELPRPVPRWWATNAPVPKETTVTLQPELDFSADPSVGPALLTVKQAGRVLAISRSSVYQLITGGRLETVHIGRSVRIPADAITSYVRTLRKPKHLRRSARPTSGAR